jgi:polysaccharide biosynthesis PFTS motif protein
MVEFALHWLHVGGMAMLAFLSRGGKKGAATLLFGVGSESLKFGEGDARFAQFCQSGPIAPLTEANRLIIQTSSDVRSTQPNRFEYVRFPLFALLHENAPSLIELLRFMLEHLEAAGAYVVAVVRLPLVSVVGRDFAYHAMVTYLNRKSLIEAVVITNSNYSAQPLWMSDLPGRRFLTHLVWYSQNTVPLVYADEPIKVNIPNFRHMRIDVSWVWTDAYAAYLRTMSIPGDIHVVGPILWYLPPVSAVPKDASNDIMFTLFDVTPVRDAVAESIGLFGSYYSAQNMTQFVEETLSVCRELESRTGRRVRLSLKHKRSYNDRTHDPRYRELISRLTASEGGIELIPFETNMYALLANSDLAIVVPYSSPAYVASRSGAHAVYFDPTKTLLPTFQPAPLVTFASGRAELLRIALDTVSDRADALEPS